MNDIKEEIKRVKNLDITGKWIPASVKNPNIRSIATLIKGTAVIKKKANKFVFCIPWKNLVLSWKTTTGKTITESHLKYSPSIGLLNSDWDIKSELKKRIIDAIKELENKIFNSL